MVESPDVKFRAAFMIALIGGGCAPVSRDSQSASRDTQGRITEATYRSAARHCHSKQVIRMRPGIRNVFSVGGLVDSKTGKPSGADDAVRIECVRQYLDIPQKDVWVVFS
jgi:hypothetical protein